MVTADRESLAAHFAVIAEPANADYVLSVEMMASLKSKRLRAKRQQWRRYTENHLGHRLVELDLGCPATRKEIGDVYAAWKRHKGLEGDGVATEQAALERCVSLGGRLGLVALGARLDDRLTAFTFNESLPGGWSVWHFAKADPKWVEASTWLDVESARYLHARGCNYANIAEDLGLPGLRASKRSWLPVKMLRKYRLSPCEN